MMSWDLILLPLAAGVLVLLSHIPLGVQVLGRGVVFLDLAMAQLAALGGQITSLYFPDKLWIAAGGVSLALCGAAWVALISRHYAHHREAMIGCLYVACVCIGLILDSQSHGAFAHKSSHGDILWVNPEQLIPLFAVALLVIATRWSHTQLTNGLLFYPLFALSVTLSVDLLGVYLVFASLIVPALLIRVCSCPLWVGYFAGIGGYAAGCLLALWQDWPAGASIVVMLMLTAIVAALSFSGVRRLAPTR